ncbi:hypothetical protein HUJ04_008328 [Dendroctonus ponderosae]|nr:hypothetical protein HUJ04_008328 [Dendroctonus ponderosae]
MEETKNNCMRAVPTRRNIIATSYKQAPSEYSKADLKQIRTILEPLVLITTHRQQLKSSKVQINPKNPTPMLQTSI